MALPIAVEKCVASRRWAGRCCCRQMRGYNRVQCAYELSVVCCSSKQSVAGNGELGGAEKRRWFTSAADFVLDVDETTRFRDSAEAELPAASAFTSHSLSPALTLAYHILTLYMKPSLLY